MHRTTKPKKNTTLHSTDQTIPTAKGYKLNEDDHIRHEVIMRIMCDFELNFKSIEEKFKIKFKDYFKWGLSNLKEFEADD